MSQLTAQHGRTGRWAELFLILLGLSLGVGGYLLTFLDRTGKLPTNALIIIGGALATGLIVHLWTRFFAPYADPILVPAAITLNGIGLAMIYRLDIAYKKLGQWQYFVGTRQVMWTAIGIIIFCLVLVIIRDHRVLRRLDRWAMWLGLIMLALPFVPGLGTEINGARIWIHVPGVGLSFQPAELTKVLLAIFFASFLVSNRDNLALAGKRIFGLNLPRLRHLGPILVVWGISLIILVLQRDLGTSLLLFGLFVVTLYVATDRPSWLIIGAALFIPAATFVATHVPHVERRLTVWLHAMEQGTYEAVGGSWQVVTSLFGLASGGLFGTGWGDGYPNLVTFSNSDFIVASVGEELGLTGSLALLLLYLVLIQRGLRTAVLLRDGFGKLLATTLSFTLAIQVFIVIGGITRLIPLTGLTTPFLAYGGSSLVANWLLLALLIRLSDAARRPAPTDVPSFIDTAELPGTLRRQMTRSAKKSQSRPDEGSLVRADDDVLEPGTPDNSPDDGHNGETAMDATSARSANNPTHGDLRTMWGDKS